MKYQPWPPNDVDSEVDSLKDLDPKQFIKKEK